MFFDGDKDNPHLEKKLSSRRFSLPFFSPLPSLPTQQASQPFFAFSFDTRYSDNVSERYRIKARIAKRLREGTRARGSVSCSSLPFRRRAASTSIAAPLSPSFKRPLSTLSVPCSCFRGSSHRRPRTRNLPKLSLPPEKHKKRLCSLLRIIGRPLQL